MKNILKVGILGLGTVGAGVVNVLLRNGDEIVRRCGVSIDVKHVAVRDLNQIRDCDTSKFTLTDDPWNVVNDPELDVIVELIGGETIAKELILAAITNGKDVVTANKALIALHGGELFSIAQSKGVSIFYEAAVAGGIGIIKGLRESLVANKIESVTGVINGTSNFILTEMFDKGIDFQNALLQAQNHGYAEADPSFDIEGLDAAYKLAILSSIAFGVPLDTEQIAVDGIASLSLQDIVFAKLLSYRIKHLAIAKLVDAKLQVRVYPALVPEKHFIANVDGVMNAVLLKSDAVGTSIYYGAGAGAEATASAVIADLVDVIRTKSIDAVSKVPALAFQPKSVQTIDQQSADQFLSRHYLRVNTDDVSPTLALLEKVFADLNINLEIIQEQPIQQGNHFITILIVTELTSESKIDNAIATIESIPIVQSNVTRIRVEHFD